MNKLFFELIQISIGSREVLSSKFSSLGQSRTISAKEWIVLYRMAEKQALVGITFHGVEKLYKALPEVCKNLPVNLRMHWLGLAANIQERNILMNKRCYELQEKLVRDGFKCSILKGQGVATLYGSVLCSLRQPGDIDVWVDGGMAQSMKYCCEKFGKVEFDYVNAHTPFYEDVEVEWHWRPFVFTNLMRNRKAQQWLESDEVKKMLTGERAKFSSDQEIVVPTWDFNAFFLMQHCYHHMFESGLGLRQIMDYYFLLLDVSRHESVVDFLLLNSWFKKYGMRRFVSAVMWIMQEVFRIEKKYLICEPNEKEGRFILNEVMAGGNFGHHDMRIRKVGKGKIQFLFSVVQHNWYLATHYSHEFLWAPVWLTYHWCWKRIWTPMVTLYEKLLPKV